MKFLLILPLFMSAVALVGCTSRESGPTNVITLATTTSTQDCGLLEVLLPAFEKESGVEVKVVAVGSGQALELGRRGDADVLLTHSPDAEKKFMDEGHGDSRRPVMHSDFVIVGPPDDPAKVKSLSNATDAFRAILEHAQPFVSRADESGTHQKELALWKSAAVEPSGDWYIKAGTGMGQALLMANEKDAYLLTDRATYLAMKAKLRSEVLLERDEQLLNRYSVITISKSKHPHIHAQEAKAFSKFLTSPSGQELILTFGIEQFGQPVFVPNAE